MTRTWSLFDMLAAGLARALCFGAVAQDQHGGPKDADDEPHRLTATLADETTLDELDRLQRERELQIMIAGWM